MSVDAPQQPPARRVKCCIGHIGGRNRKDRRAADRVCTCRGECGWHSTAAAGSTARMLGAQIGRALVDELARSDT